MKAILREVEIGVQCEGEMTRKGESTGNELEELRVCGVCVSFSRSLHPLHAADLTPLFRSEMDS